MPHDDYFDDDDDDTPYWAWAVYAYVSMTATMQTPVFNQDKEESVFFSLLSQSSSPSIKRACIELRRDYTTDLNARYNEKGGLFALVCRDAIHHSDLVRLP